MRNGEGRYHLCRFFTHRIALPIFLSNYIQCCLGVGNCFKNITKSSQFSSNLDFFTMKFGMLTQKHIPQLLSVGFLETLDNCYVIK